MQVVPLPLGGPVQRRRLGVERELSLWRGKEAVDFRQLIDVIAGHLAPLDPGDPRARRLPSGVALTADGREAELATPPLPVSFDTPRQIDALLRTERTELRDLVALHGVGRISGFSTHLNVSVPDRRAVKIGRQFAATCALGLAAITEPARSLGVFVRPRRGRLEFGCEYVEGNPLVAALTLFAACVTGLEEGSTPPGGGCASTVPSREKFGWFIGPHALDNAAELGKTWGWARKWCVTSGLDPDPVDVLVDGAAEAPRSDECSFGSEELDPAIGDTAPRTLANGLRAETEWLTWQHVVWLFRDQRGAQCRAVVPADLEGDFLRLLDAGILDPLLEKMLRRPVVRRRLLVNAQLTGPGLWHDVRPGALVPAERLADGTVPRVSRRAARRSHRRAQQEVDA